MVPLQNKGNRSKATNILRAGDATHPLISAAITYRRQARAGRTLSQLALVRGSVKSKTNEARISQTWTQHFRSTVEQRAGMNFIFSADSEHPRISVELAIEPQVYTPGSEKRPKLSITATLLGADQPITIFTYNSIFNTRRSLEQGNFTCRDLDTGEVLKKSDEILCLRSSFVHRRGHSHSRYHHTLRPGVPRTFEHEFRLAKSSLQDGHRYSFGVAAGQGIGWWCWGTKSEVLREKTEPQPVSEKVWIPIKHVEPAEFCVEFPEADTSRTDDDVEGV